VTEAVLSLLVADEAVRNSLGQAVERLEGEERDVARTERQINAWIVIEPLVRRAPATLWIGVGPARPGPLAGDRRAVVEDVPAEGLEATWIVSSDAFRLEALDDSVQSSKSTGPYASGWHAGFTLHIPANGRSRVMRLRVTPQKRGPGTIDLGFYSNDRGRPPVRATARFDVVGSTDVSAVTKLDEILAREGKRHVAGEPSGGRIPWGLLVDLRSTIGSRGLVERYPALAGPAGVVQLRATARTARDAGDGRGAELAVRLAPDVRAFQTLGPDAGLRLPSALADFTAARASRAKRALVEAHPELLSAEADHRLSQARDQALRADAHARAARLDRCLALLRIARAAPVTAALSIDRGWTRLRRAEGWRAKLEVIRGHPPLLLPMASEAARDELGRADVTFVSCCRSLGIKRVGRLLDGGIDEASRLLRAGKARDALDAEPDLLTDSGSAVLALTEPDSELNRLVHWCRELGVDATLAIWAGETLPEPIPRFSILFMSSLNAALTQPRATVGIWQRVLDHPAASLRRGDIATTWEQAGYAWYRESHSGDGHALDTAIDCLDRAAAALPVGEPPPDHLIALLGSALGQRFECRSNPADLEHAVDVMEAALRGCWGYPTEVMRILGNVLALRARDGDVDRAIQLWSVAASAARWDTDELIPIYQSLANGLIVRYAERGAATDLDDAIACCEEGLVTGPRAEVRNHLLVSLAIGLRLMYEGRGRLRDLDRAIGLLQCAAESDPTVAVASNLGTALWMRSLRPGRGADVEEAVTSLQQAVDGTSQDEEAYARRIDSLGVVLRRRFEYTGNLDDLRKALKCHKRAHALVRQGSAESRRVKANLGSAFIKLGERTGDQVAAARALEINLEVLEDTDRRSPQYAGSLANVAAARRLLLIGRGDEPNERSRAVAEYRSACIAGAGRSDAQILQVAISWADWAEQRRNWREAAEAMGFAVESMGRLFRAQPARDDKETFLRESQTVAARAAWARHRAKDPLGAAQALEEGRAMLLSEALELERAKLDVLVRRRRADLAERYRSAAQRWRRLSMPLDGPGDNQPPSHDLASGARDELDAVIEEIKAAGAKDFLDPPVRETVLSEAASSTLVYVAATPGGGLSLTIGGRSGRPRGRELTGLTERALHDQVDAFMTAYHRRRVDRRGWFEQLDAVTAWLWTAVMADVLADVDPRRDVTIVPCGALSALPLHAAWTPDDRKSIGRRYALDQACIAYAPNARALAAARQIAGRASVERLFAVDEPRPVHAAPLPTSQSEIAAARMRFNRRPKVLRGEQADLRSVFDQLGRWPIQHFSCHGKALPAAPLDSYLLLAHDCRLRLREILALTAAPDRRLAFLSACETLVVGEDVPDEVIGLPSGFLQAGFAGAIGSLWAVPAVPTAALVFGFYRAWRPESASTANALRTAQKWVRDTTNGKKIKELEAAESAAGVGRAFRPLLDELRRRDASARSMQHPAFWGAFACVGL